MKRPITPAYTFNPGAATLNLSGISGFDVRNLFAVIDLKTGALIYAPMAGTGFSALSGTTLTLQAPMTGLAASDPLLILYDDGGRPAEDASVQAAVSALGAIHTDLTSGLANDATALGAISSTAAWQTSVLTALTTLHSDSGTTLHADLQAVAAKVPALGQASGANSLPVVLSSDGPFATHFGVKTDAAATDDTGAWSLVALVKRSLVRLSAIIGNLPSAIGQLTAAQSFSVVLASNHPAVPILGTVLVNQGTAGSAAWPVAIGRAATAGDGSIVAGGTAQTLFGGAAPANGWKVANPDPAEDLWVSDSATAAPNAQGCYRVPAGGIVTTEPGERPCGPVSVYGATTGHVVTARSW